MDLLARHWLGTAWVVFGVWGMFATSVHPKEPAILPLFVAGVLFWVWVFRGFVRFVGRAWHHGARNAQNGSR